jgi:formylglycine-generating enzyme required for sulfatase activity
LGQRREQTVERRPGTRLHRLRERPDPASEVSLDERPADGRGVVASGRVARVARGGSWHDVPDVCRSAARLRARASEGDELMGLRVALALD